MGKKSVKKYISLLLSLLMLVTCFPFCVTAEDEEWYIEDEISFEINSYQQLVHFAQLVNGGKSFSGKTVSLTADIDLNNQEWTPIGSGTNTFQGTFNGNGYKISNLLVTGSNRNVGLFGKTENAVIKRLTVEGSVSGGENTAVFVGYSSFTSFINCVNNATASGTSDVGAFAGMAIKCTFSGCRNNGAITASSNYAGGIAGYNQRSTAINCKNSNTAVITAVNYAGGMSGYCFANASTDAIFKNCINDGNVYATQNNTSAYAGGITAHTNGDGTVNAGGTVYITNCINSGVVNISNTGSGNGNYGGIVGECASYTTIAKCINIGTSKKGIAGKVTASANNTASSCYYLSESDGFSSGTTKKSEANLKTTSTYTGYGVYASEADVEINPGNVWIITQGSYPTLYWNFQESCEHTYNDTPDSIIESTCIAIGHKYYSCTKNCGYILDEEIPFGEHKYVSEVTTPSTCKDKGEKTFTCSVCLASYTEEITELAAHQFEYIAAENKLRCPVCNTEKQSDSGECGDNVTWSLEIATGKLSFAGSGDMYDYTASTTPWDVYKGMITSVEFAQTVTSVGASAFEGFVKLDEAELPATITKIGSRAFANCAALTTLKINCTTATIATDVIDESILAEVQATCDSSFFTTLKDAGVVIQSCGNHQTVAATCTSNSYCSVCLATLGNDKLDHTYVETKYSETQHGKKCSVCGTWEGKYENHNGTATCTAVAHCTVCNSDYGDKAEHTYIQKYDESYHWEECSVCKDIKGSNKTPHSGGKATCTAQAVCSCEWCKQSYGTTANHTYTVLQSDSTQHWYKCANCTATTDKVNHSGGTATCTALKVCEVCAKQYGELDADNHINIYTNQAYTTYTVGASESTCTTPGNTGYTYCYGCKQKVKGITTDNQPINELKPHTGGTATCAEKAECEVCHQKYGELAQHVYATSRTSDGTYHYYACTNSNCTSVKDKAECSGGTANCKNAAVCTTCNKPYGEVDSTNHIGKYEIKNAAAATCYDTGYSGDTYCSACNGLKSKGSVTDKLNHKGGTATCKEKATCTLCKQPYGELNPNNHSNYGTYDDTESAVAPQCTVAGKKADKRCSGCNTVIQVGEEIKMTSHTGGTATCTAKKICTKCNTPYGEVDPNYHYDLANGKSYDKIIINKVDTTSCNDSGYTGDEVCAGCKAIFTHGKEIPATGHIPMPTSGENEQYSWSGSYCKYCGYAEATVTLHAKYSNSSAVASKKLNVAGSTVNTDASGNATLPKMTTDNGKYTVEAVDGSYKVEFTVGANCAITFNVITAEAPTTPPAEDDDPTTPDDPSPDDPSEGDDDDNWFKRFINKLLRFIIGILNSVGFNIEMV